MRRKRQESNRIFKISPCSLTVDSAEKYKPFTEVKDLQYSINLKVPSFQPILNYRQLLLYIFSVYV